ncbi:ricin-type beta-trefoil lectin domain protein [Actinoplanes sichuanensis]|nr:ricin-type beta-trefoil lectin domain protein [Actinoplanes sichuanensis]
MALSLGVPPEVVPEGGGWPVAGLLSPFRQVAALGAVTGLPEQKLGAGTGDDHYVATDETQAEGGAGRAPGRGKGAVDPALPAEPAAKRFTTPPLPGGENSFDPVTSERLPEKSTATYTEFENEDGSITRQIHDSRVNYRAADGSYQPIDTSLTRNGDRLDAGANSIDVSLSAVGTDAVEEPTPTPSAAVEPTSEGDPLASITTASGHTMAYDLDGAAPVQAVLNGDTATYPEILPGTDLELRSLNDGLKETLILKSPAAGNEWVFPLKLDGLTPKRQTDRSIDLVAANGAVVMRIPPGYMQDSKVDPKSGAPAESSGVQYELITRDGGQALKVTADAAWLNDPARQYPVRVDPTSTWKTADTGDVFADDSTSTTDHNGDNLPVGTWDGGTTRSRSFIHFDDFDNDGLKGTQIRSAKLVLFHTWSYNCSSFKPVNIHRITEPWTVTSLANNGKLADAPTYSAPIGQLQINDNTKACGNTAGNRGVGEFRAASLPVTTFNGWSSGTMPNLGLALTASETDSTAFKRFTSANYGGAATDPYLELTYDYNVDAQVNEQYPVYGAAAQTLQPELIADAQDPDNWPKSLMYRFILYSKDAKTEIANSGNWSTKKSWTVPAGKMVWGESYYWTVMVSDGLTNNEDYLSKHLLVTPVPQPSITSGLSQNSGQGFDPVIGNYTTTVRDAMVATVGPPLEISRAYNSIDPRSDQAFGAGWSSLLDAKAVVKSAAIGGTAVVNTVVVTYPNGREMAFGRNANGTWSSPAGLAASFTELTADAGYRLREKDGSVYEYAQKVADGRFAISSITDVSGRKQKFTYTDNVLTTITAASGRTLTFQWNATAPKRVTSVSTDPATPGNTETINTWTYEYADGALTKVCPPTGTTECRTYQYETTRSLFPTATTNARPHSYWRLAETSGDKAYSEMLENGGTDVATHTGVTLGQPGPLAGTSATAAGFNGTSSQLQVPAKLASDATNQAISMWFKTGSEGVLYGQSLEPTSSTAATTRTAYNPTLYIGADGRLMGGFPKAPKPGTTLGTLLAAGQGQCLTVPGNTSTNGTVLALANCSTAANQVFSWATNQQLLVTTGGVTKCLDTDDQGVTNGADLIINSCNASFATQKWDVQVDGQIINVGSSLCMDSVGDGSQAGAAMQIWTCGKNRPVDQLFTYRNHTPMESTATVANNKWHHVVLSAAGNRQELYVDGDQVDFENGVTVQDLSPNSSYVGKGFVGGGWPNQSHGNTTSNVGTRDYFAGSIAEVALFENAVDERLVKDLWAAKSEVKQLTRVVRPSTAAASIISYDGVTGRVSRVVDGNGSAWEPKAPVLGGTSKVYESAVLGGAPTNYWRMAEKYGGVAQAVNQVNGSTATYNMITLGSAGPFGTAGTAAGLNGTSSFVELPSGSAPKGDNSVSMWFKTTSTKTMLLGPKYSAFATLNRLEMPSLWITADGKLRGLSPSKSPTGPMNSIGIAGKCIDVDNGNTNDGTAIQSWACNGSTAQNLSLVPTDAAASRFTLQVLGKCVTPNGAGTANGTLLKLWTCNNSASQQFYASAEALYNPSSGRCIDIPGSSKTNGTDLQLYDCNSTGAQKWLPSLTSKTAVNDDKWHHVALTTDGTNQALYVDGVKTQSSAGTRAMDPDQEHTYTVGAGYMDRASSNFYYLTSEATSYFKGTIGEVAFYASELDASQASYQFKARDAVKSAPSGQIDYTILGPDNSSTSTIQDLMYGRKVADVDALTNVTRYGYSGKGNLRTITDANGNMTINEHDDRGNVVSATNCQDRSANNCSTSYSTYYLNTGNPADVRNDRLLQQRGPGSASATDNKYLTTFEYDARGNRTSEIDPLGRRTSITYTDGDKAGGYQGGTAPADLPWKIVKPNGGMQTILYYPSGDIAEQTDPAGAVTRYEYDGLGRTVKEYEYLGTTDGVDDIGSQTLFEHDRLDRVVKTTDTEVTNEISGAVHRPVTTLAYNLDGLLLSEKVSDERGGDMSREVTYTYDAFGRRDSETDERDFTTRYGYDAFGRMNKQTNADGTIQLTEFDAAGNETKTWVQDPDAENADDRNRLIRSLAYDPAGRLASETDAMKYVTKYTYTDNNLLATVTRTNGCDTAVTPGCTLESYVLESNTYDEAGNRTKQVTNNGLTTTNHTYDNVGRGTAASVTVTDTDDTVTPAVTTTGTRTTKYTYSADDDVVNSQVIDGSTVLLEADTSYDRLGRVHQQTRYLSGGLKPTARWKMNHSGTTASDWVGRYSATYQGAATWTSENGGALSFPGTGPAYLSALPPVDTLRPFTITAKAKLGIKDANRYVASVSGDIGDDAMRIFFDRANDAWRIEMAVRKPDGTTTTVQSTYTTGSAALSTWQQLAVVATPATRAGEASVAQLYVDGVEKGRISTTEFQFNNRATGLLIGTANPDSGTFAGLIGDMQTYQKALTATEIGQVVAGTAPSTSASVSRTTYALSADGAVDSVTDPNGNTTYIKNDEVGRPVVTTSPAFYTVEGEGSVESAVSVNRVGYNTFGEVTEQEDPRKKVTINRYDGVGNLVETQSPAYTAPGSTEPVKAFKKVEYNQAGQVELTIDPNGAETDYEYDVLGRTTKITTPDGGITRYEYTPNGDLLMHTDPNGSAVASTYDYLGRTTDSTSAVRQDSAGYTTKYEYTNSPWPTKVTSPGNVVTRAKYNSVGEPTQVIDAANNVTKTKYDGAGRPVRTTSPDGSFTSVVYDYAGRAVRSSDYAPGGTTALRTRTQTYDYAGNLRLTTDGVGTERTFYYNALGLLTEQNEPTGSDPNTDIVTKFGYDKAGNPTRFTDGRGNNFVTTYNSWGLVESQIEPATTSTPNAADRTFKLAYDKAGRVTRLDSPGGVSVTSEYDVMGRLKKSSGTGAQVATADKTYDYDLVGRMTAFTGSAGTNTIAYDDRGLVKSISGVSGNSSYEYNNDGLPTKRVDGAGTTTYGYDNAGRPASVQNTAAGVNMTYGYNNLSQVETIAYGGNTRTLKYDNLKRLASDELKTSAGVSVGKLAYEWNLNDSLTKKTTTGFNGASTNTYKYDLADRLTQWDNGVTPVLYAYDKSGNRTQAGTKTFAYDQRNQLTSDSDGTTYQYTARGTLASTMQNGQTVETVNDAFNQVVTQGSKNGGRSTYSYDGLGRVIQPNLTYTGLGNDVAADGSSVYVRDVADQLVGVKSAAGNRYAWTDTHTDVVGEFTATGTVLSGSVSYDPWGKVLAAGGMTGRLGYQQEWTDQTTGKVNMWSRWYDPQTGAFDTRDTATNSPTPASGAANRFAYAEGDPMSNTDTTGNAVDGKCGEYDYACAVKQYQAELAVYTGQVEQRDRDMKATGAEIAAQEAEYQRAVAESQTSLLDILLQVGVGMLLDMIGYNSVVGCLGGSIFDCVDLAMSALGPIKALKIGRSLFNAADRALTGYRTWKRIVDGAQTVMRRSQDLMNQARKHLNDIMQKVPKKPKPPKKKVKPPAKKKPKPKPKPEPKPKPAKQSKPQKPKTEPKKEKKPSETKAAKPKSQNSQPSKRQSDDARPDQKADEGNRPEPARRGCKGTAGIPVPGKKHSFDPDTLVLMADGSARPISEINPGDEVLAKDPLTGAEGARPVTLLHANRDVELTDVTVSDQPTAVDGKSVNEGKGDRTTRGPTEPAVLATTAHHPFWDATTGAWIDAADLVAGESTLVGPDGQIQYVTEVRNFTGSKVMRDLTVDDIHTYFVVAQETPILVHNCNDSAHEDDCYCDYGDTPKPRQDALSDDLWDQGDSAVVEPPAVKRDTHGVLAAGDDGKDESDLLDIINNPDRRLRQASDNAAVYIRDLAQGRFYAVIRRADDGGPVTSFELSKNSLLNRIKTSRWIDD